MSLHESGPVMAPTDERMVPESAAANTFWEHVYRYRFARAFVPGKRVLDVACGEGYGTKALSLAGATRVVGVDVSAESCQHARAKYGVDARAGDAMKLPLEVGEIDVVVSFETIEHLSDPAAFLDECKRVLSPHGLLIISTPNSPVYDPHGGTNPYHVSEMDERQFEQLVSSRFDHVQFFSQGIESADLLSLRYLCARRNLPRRILRKLKRGVSKLRARDTRSEKPRPADVDPVQAILAESNLWNRLFDPLIVRPCRHKGNDQVMMILAVCRQSPRG